MEEFCKKSKIISLKKKKKPTATSAFIWKSDFLLTIVDEQKSAIWREITENFIFLPNEFLLGGIQKLRWQDKVSVNEFLHKCQQGVGTVPNNSFGFRADLHLDGHV